jgi:hypothetical protein
VPHRRAQDYRFSALCICTLQMHSAITMEGEFKIVDIGSKEGSRAADIGKE